MIKTPISIALERQIPEFIREEHAVFVNFIKAYYAFLDETQQRNLEDIRSIENTLDEFIIRFKKELSAIFPTNALQNERFILQRIREFYKTRGSSESFQFLFRILFNKEAEIYYPSKQILRVSDGSWIQEKSLFVKQSSGNLFHLGGKIITIRTDMKNIQVFCPRVVYYRENIYEVFIDRSYIEDIFIDNIVLSEDGLDVGTIIPCPSKYTIVTSGSGFEIGALYHLPSESGNGSLIKIAKIGTNGSIKKIQIISFGLDYESVFYAKLSNKTRQAFSYYTPITSFTVGSGHPSGLFPTSSYTTTNPYSDNTTGYMDIGYMNKQDYFAYDIAYTPTISANQNVFYADGTYVGEIIGSFYTNNSNDSVIDDTLAEIKIELGPVAIYPGYYSKSDGFISDESFIQDGKYYQLFSYVIKVEQQIESYRDIIKSLLHPAGFEMFAEYNIKNTYLVSASPLNAFIRRQFTDQQFATDDDSANAVNKFLSELQTAYHSNTEDIKDVIKILEGADGEFQTILESKYYDMLKGSAGDPIENSLTSAYHVDTQDIKDNTKLSTDNTQANHVNTQDIKDVLKGSAGDPIENSLTSAYHDITADIKDNAKLSEDVLISPTDYDAGSKKDNSKLSIDVIDPIEAIDNRITYIRDKTYLNNGGETTPFDTYFPIVEENGKDVTPATKTDEYTVVGGDWSLIGSAYVQNFPEVRIGVAYFRTPEDSINNITNIATLYFSAYSQNDTADPNTSYSYEAEVYSVHDTRVIS